MPITIAEAIQGGTVEVPTLNGTQADPVPAGTSTARCSGCAARGRRARAARGAATSATGSRSRSRTTSAASRARGRRRARRGLQRRGPPRERLMREASASGKVGRLGEGRWHERATQGAARPRPSGRRHDRRGPRRVHDLGRRRAGRDAPADPAHVRGARPDHAAALAEEHAALLPARRRAPAPHPADDRARRASTSPASRRCSSWRSGSRGCGPSWSGCASAPRSSSRTWPGRSSGCAAR